MRVRGGRLAIGAILVLLAVTVVACNDPGPGPSMAAVESSQSTSPSPSASPTEPPVDPAATVEVCGLASTASVATTTIFNEQIAALEQAAAQGDQAAMLAAAEAINQKFVDLAETMTRLANRPVAAELRTVLTDIASALTDMSALSYTGTTVDIRKKLLDFAAAITRVCAPPTSATASPSAG
jgi:hypothetical protein